MPTPVRISLPPEAGKGVMPRALDTRSAPSFGSGDSRIMQPVRCSFRPSRNAARGMAIRVGCLGHRRCNRGG